MESTILLNEESPTAPAAPGSVWVVVRMVLVLVLAALAVYGVVYVVKRAARRPEPQDPHLKVLASVRLGGAAFAAVLSLGSKAWLVGGGEHGVSLIAEVDEAEALEAMLLEDSRREAAGGVRFPDFRAALERLGGGGPGRAPGNAHAEALRRQRERLKGL